MDILGISINQKTQSLEVQEVSLNSDNGVIQIKGGVGSGKSTSKNSAEYILAGGKKSELNFDISIFDNFEGEVQLSMGDNPVYMNTKTSAGQTKSIVYMKDGDRIKRNPTIDGTQMTVAKFRDILKTDLTFGTEAFLSENTKTHMEFMQKVYRDKLTEKGVVFDKKSPNYVNSILYKLDLAKVNRMEKEHEKKAVNGFKGRLEAEGYKEEDKPEYIDITKLQAKREKLIADGITAERDHTKSQYDGETSRKDMLSIQMDAIKSEASTLQGVVVGYNSSLESADEVRKNGIREEVRKHNEGVTTARLDYNKVTDSISVLKDFGFASDDFDFFIAQMVLKIKDIRYYEDEVKLLPPLELVPMKDGQLSDLTPRYTQEVNNALTKIKQLRADYRPLKTEYEKPFEPKEFDSTPYSTDKIDEEIRRADDSNLIHVRWNAYQAHYNADQKVKKIWDEYCKMFTSIDLGVDGLSIQVIGTEDNYEIRTMYNGCHYPELFRNEDKEDRKLTSYSLTQRSLIAVLMQIYLLEEKTKKGENGLRYIWIECPTDNRTLTVLNDLKAKHDLNIIVSVTGDFEPSKTPMGSYVIENGKLLKGEKE